MVNQLIAPYGGALVNLIDSARTEALKLEAFALPSLDLGWQQQCELEMLMNGAYSPLAGFMTHAQCARVERERQLDDGTFWPLPVTLASPAKVAAGLKPGERVALRDGEGFMLAVLTVSDIWQEGDCWHLGGPVEGAALPPHPDFVSLRATPAELRTLFARRGWRESCAPGRNTPARR